MPDAAAMFLGSTYFMLKKLRMVYQMPPAPEERERDRYAEASSDLASHIGDKVLAILRTKENQDRLQTVLDPIVSHIINRVFPYILLSAILFLILFILTIGTFWMVMRNGFIAPVAAVTAAMHG